MKFATVMISALLVSGLSTVQAIKYGDRVKTPESFVRGFTGGRFYDDTDVLGPANVTLNMKEVIITHNERIDGFQTKFDLKDAPVETSHGTTTADDGRQVTPIDVRTDPIIKVGFRPLEGGFRIAGLDLVQRSGKVTQVGAKKGFTISVEPPEPNMGLIGFHGRAGQEIDTIGIIWGKELPEQ